MLDLMLREMGGMPALSPRPLRVLDGLDRTLAPLWWWSPPPTEAWPRFDVTHADDAVVITAEVPGLGDDDVSVVVAGRQLTIEGASSRPGRARQFRRQFTLADGLEADRIEAQLDRGVLTVLIPKAAGARPRRIELGRGVVDKVRDLLRGDGDQ